LRIYLLDLIIFSIPVVGYIFSYVTLSFSAARFAARQEILFSKNEESAKASTPYSEPMRLTSQAVTDTRDVHQHQ
jgi:hypothetical protein